MKKITKKERERIVEVCNIMISSPEAPEKPYWRGLMFEIRDILAPPYPKHKKLDGKPIQKVKTG